MQSAYQFQDLNLILKVRWKLTAAHITLLIPIDSTMWDHRKMNLMFTLSKQGVNKVLREKVTKKVKFEFSRRK